MQLNPAVFDVWVFRRTATGVEFLVLLTSQIKADRFFNGGRFWQIPSGVFRENESVPDAIDRVLARFGLTAHAVWAAEHVYAIYNRRFHEMQLIGVYAAELTSGTVELDPAEHAEFAWVALDDAMSRVHYRGLKEGLEWTHRYVTGTTQPAAELRLR
jgi:hypothetical protein